MTLDLAPKRRLLRRDLALPPAPVRGERAIEVDGVGVDRGDRAVLRDIHLHVDHGEVVALVGPNGAGKTTLLAALGGDLEYRGGSIRIAGRDLQAWSGRELALRRAVLLQDNELSFPFTVRDTVMMGRAPWADTAAAVDDDRYVDAALAAVDVADLADRAVTRVSGGERARAAFARVLAQDTSILLLDEPTASLDIHHQELLLGLVRRRAAEGVAVVVVLHDLGLAAAYADRVAVLADGGIAAVGRPREVLTGPLLSRVYGHAVDVLPHPRTGELLIVPVR